MPIARLLSSEFKAYNAMILKTLEQNGTTLTTELLILYKEDVDILRAVTMTKSSRLEDALNSIIKDR